jgi:hypothetical protein
MARFQAGETRSRNGFRDGGRPGCCEYRKRDHGSVIRTEALRPSTGPARSGYVAHILTPNMWEGPRVRKLLSELPISQYENRDLWSPPPARPRVRRLQIRVESLLPGPLRPTRRRLRQLISPDGPSVFVYNTWGLDPMVRVELANLLSALDDVGVVSVDEPMRDSARTYARIAFAVRVGFGAAQYRGAQNVLVAPLGVPNNFAPAESRKPIRERSFSWAFLGEVKNESRRKMVEHLNRRRAREAGLGQRVLEQRVFLRLMPALVQHVHGPTDIAYGPEELIAQHAVRSARERLVESQGRFSTASSTGISGRTGITCGRPSGEFFRPGSVP